MTKILVTGDQSVDYNIYLPSTEQNPPPGSPPAHLDSPLGGAGIVYKVLKQVIQVGQPRGEAPFEVHFSSCEKCSKPSSYPIAAIWHPQELGILGGDEKSQKAKVWRLTRSVSLNLASAMPVPAEMESIPEAPTDLVPDVLLLEDDAMDFRYDRKPHNTAGVPTLPGAPTAEPTGKTVSKYASLFGKQATMPRWIIHKMTGPICHGDLWWYLMSNKALLDRLIVIVSIKDLRKESVRVSRDISWERTAQDLVCEICHNPELSGLRAAGHLIVTFHGDGALWMERVGQRRPEFHLIFDPQHMEGEWSVNYAPQGEAYGFLASFAASVATHLAKGGLETAATGIDRGIRHGLWTMRLLRGLGHGFLGNGKPGLPAHELAEVIMAKSLKDLLGEHTERMWLSKGKLPLLNFKHLGQIGRTKVPSEEGACTGNQWRILEDVDAVFVRPPTEPLYGVARRVALLGLGALGQIPHARFGKLVTMDRDEIESLRNLKQMILEYRDDLDRQKPLSLAVFGPPGAGKSFGIKEIANTVVEEKRRKFLEYNLSQFDEPSELIGALHQVRDNVLDGKLPVVFWDEFDSDKYKWLQYLLAPMHDGKFQEGEITHPIGRCIFVFAGATSYNFERFGQIEDDKEARENFKLRKGPDFKSRLHGYLNVLGPNPRENGIIDVCFPVRRALLLRSMLGYMGKRENDRMEIEMGLLAALLDVAAYRNGARSMEKIADCLKLGDKQSFCRSALPTDEILEMNIETVKEFRSIMGRTQRFQKYAEQIGPAIHEFFRSQVPSGHRLNVDFDVLSDEQKADNYAAAMRIPLLLELVGLYLVPEESPEKAVVADKVDKLLEKHLDLLAEEEHNRWMRFKMDNGWRYGTPRCDHAKEHDCVKLYAELSDSDKAKDQASVRNFPAMVALAKFKIVAVKPKLPA